MTNWLDRDYHSMLVDIINNGKKKADRTGTGTLSVFGRQIRHDMRTGFPLLTTKKMAWKSIVTELLWFLKGGTNIKYLIDNGCHTWDGDAYKNYDKFCIDTKWMEPVKKELNDEVYDMGRKYDQEGFINRIKTDTEFAMKWGELGPIYGNQWREWGSKYETNYILGTTKLRAPGIDQIAKLISDLKSDPDSRRLMVSAWNVSELDNMTLPPCHYGFQVYTTEMSLDDRCLRWAERVGHNEHYSAKMNHQDLDDRSFPRRKISLQWSQRSVDTFLGLPFNIASYGLLLEILAKEVGMLPDQLIGNLGDTHLYLNHLEQASKQIRKEPFTLPKLVIDKFDETNHYIGDMDDISDYNIDQFKLENYQSHPAIKAPLSN